MNNPIIHAEVLGKDAGALQRFYGEAFGWEFDSPSLHSFGEMNYRIAFPSGEGIPAGVGGNLPADVRPGILFYVCVDSLDETLRDVRRLGGKVVRPPRRASEEGVRTALIEDLEGNSVGLVERASIRRR